MLNQNHQNSSCDFSADLISYLYGEIDRKAKSRLEAHLAECSLCPIELAEFSEVQTAFGEWRSEFAQMPTPVIEIPFVNAAPAQLVSATIRDSWLDRLRQMFSLSPAWSAATAAMALLLVCSGLLLLATNVFQSNEVAKNLSSSGKPVSPTIDSAETQLAENSSAPIDASLMENEVTERAAPPPKTTSRANDSFAKNELSAKPIAAKVVARSADVQKSVKQTNRISSVLANKGKNTNKTTIPVNSSAPTLNNYEEIEDETLRLADLFAEVDTKN